MKCIHFVSASFFGEPTRTQEYRDLYTEGAEGEVEVEGEGEGRSHDETDETGLNRYADDDDGTPIPIDQKTCDFYNDEESVEADYAETVIAPGREPKFMVLAQP